MRYHRSLLLALAALPLLVPAAASAKEITRAEVCGAADCAVVTDRPALRALMDIGPLAAPPKARAAHYRVRLTISAGEEPSPTSTLTYVPSAGLARVSGVGDWVALNARAEALLAEAASGLEPFPAARLRAVPAAARAADSGGGFPWAVPAVLVGMLGVFGLGWAGQRAAE